MADRGGVTHSSHFGAFRATVESGRLRVIPHPGDPDPAPLLRNLAVLGSGKARVDQPHVRRGWLAGGPGPDTRRGHQEFVPVDWDTATELLAGELGRVYSEYGPGAVYGGSYGWGSAGRFHHAQSQVHRFLNCLGGYVPSLNSYSTGASPVLLSHVVGSDAPISRPTTWPVLAEHTELFVCFGGLPAKNTFVAPGGASRHQVGGYLRAAKERGARFVNISPLRDDLATELDARWLPVRPGTDVPVMLAIAHTLLTEGRHDKDFLDRYCVGFAEFARYLRGETDGTPKTPEWAAAITELPAATIRELARRMAGSRTLVSVSWSLQRARHGEQPVWLGVVLAAMLGQLGLPGGGFGHGYGSMAGTGSGRVPVSLPRLPQGADPAADLAIPVARIADMLLHAGELYDYNGERRVYPDIRLVYWSGGNPFHHHQDLGRLRRAFARPDTVVVHEPFWTATARHADIVLPATITLERNDIGAAREDDLLVAMRQVRPPHGEARDDYRIFTDLAEALGVVKEFTEGRTELGWLRHMYTAWQQENPRLSTPDFEEFWRTGEVELRAEPERHVLFSEFRADPDRHRLATPSGRIEISSARIAGFGYPDCPGHPAWLPPEEWLGSPAAQRFPLQLIANNPATRLHSQLDHGPLSAASKVAGREPIRMHPADAEARGLAAGAVVRVFNDRGACLAGLVVTEDVRPGVVQLSTGAWFDPDETGMCRHGNPNVLTLDVGTSALAQGCSGQLTLVQVAGYAQRPPEMRAFESPRTTT
ncbi:MAG TPA: molybdopterin-dependent oxidoreductase [Pseudonocardiaceae bacterium]|nr:molybdopterin-dependent oxidoreductase [Pseudonocardiaceae bacterium]